MASNSFVFLIVFLVVTFVMYKAASGHPNIVENWWGTLPAMQSQVNSTTNGAATYGNNQQQLYYNNNQFINPSLLNPTQQSVVSQTILPQETGISQSSADGGGDKGPSEAQRLASQFDSTEGYQGPNPGFPVYTVPGTYQADLSPRFNSVGLNSFVKYNLPDQNNLASYSNDPLTMEATASSQEYYKPMDMVNMVERPVVREDYKSGPKKESKPTYAQMNKKLADMGAQVTDKLPVQPMGGSGSGKEPIYYNADRYIFALQKSRLYGQADFIRGDIPIVPTLPNADINSNVWFRPSVTPRTDLNAGALGVIGGTYNTTQQQLLEMMARSGGGSMGVINGVNANPTGTPANVIKTNMNRQVSQMVSQSGQDQGNQFEQKLQALGGGPGSVTTSGFP